MPTPKKTVVADLSLTPVGVGTSLSKYVAGAVEAIREYGHVKFRVTPMSTVLEAERIEDIFGAAKAAHDALIRMGVKRVECILRIDDRRDKSMTMNSKVEAVEKILGKT